ncbi:hypothetical protein MHYP_G00183270 [Metynnis hypsauchen]
MAAKGREAESRMMEERAFTDRNQTSRQHDHPHITGTEWKWMMGVPAFPAVVMKPGLLESIVHKAAAPFYCRFIDHSNSWHTALHPSLKDEKMSCDDGDAPYTPYTPLSNAPRPPGCFTEHHCNITVSTAAHGTTVSRTFTTRPDPKTPNPQNIPAAFQSE